MLSGIISFLVIALFSLSVCDKTIEITTKKNAKHDRSKRAPEVFNRPFGSLECTFHDKKYADGSTFYNNARCEQCRCTSGNIFCRRIRGNCVITPTTIRTPPPPLLSKDECVYKGKFYADRSVVPTNYCYESCACLTGFIVCKPVRTCITNKDSNVLFSRTTPTISSTTTDNSNTCTYDNKIFNNGDVIESKNACQKCRCLAGFVTCFKVCFPTEGTTPVLEPQSDDCLLPNHPENGKWSLINGMSALPQTLVKVQTLLKFTCDPNYKLSPPIKFVVCFDGMWSNKPPTCVKFCPPLTNTSAIRVTCHKQNTIVDCDEATDETFAKFECAAYYEPLDKRDQIRHCFDGSWNLPSPQCVPACGREQLNAETLIIRTRVLNGNDAELGYYPWVTAIYHNQNGSFLNVCGGSMLNQRVILTAAHCATNKNGTLLEKKLIKIGVGKTHNKYLDPRDTNAQYSDIYKIIKNPKYNGRYQQFASDIAVLITKDVLVLSKNVQPICFRNLNNIPLTNTMKGVVTGWGYTEPGGNPSDELQEAHLFYKDDETCTKELPSELVAQYFTYDKFCAGNDDQAIAVCKGDSGGGLAFFNKEIGRFYIQGIVSIGFGSKSRCYVHLDALFTKVSIHSNWLESLTDKYK